MSSEIISTKNGKVNGKVVDLQRNDAKLVIVYRNIPFAKPPVGNLRFAPPQPAESWEGVKDGTVVGNMPMYPPAYEQMLDTYLPFPQPDDSKPVSNEDCLHLSVYVPKLEKKKKIPVMVYFYGGAFNVGSERKVDGSMLAGMNVVIVVVPNYRVGIFGFLSLGLSSSCTGNFGLMDQQLSLKWIRENIDSFGGDANNITIFGESAGSVSVHHHMMSPLSLGLFHKGISSSCQATMADMFLTEAGRQKVNKIMFEQLKLKEEGDDEMIEALRKMSAEDLIKAHMELMETQMFHFLPVVDGKVIPKSPNIMQKNNEFAKLPYIIGYNSTEGMGLVALGFGPDFEAGVSEERAKNESLLSLSESAFQECKQFYVGDNTDPTRFSKMVGNSYSDANIITPAIQTASIHSKGGADIYSYVCNFQLRMHHDDEYGPDVGKKGEWCICDHCDELYMILGAPFSVLKFPHGVKFSDEEADISRKFMTYLTNFAKSGNPNKGKPVDKKWPKYKPGGKQLVVANPISTVKNAHEQPVKFWTDVMSKYINQEGKYF